MKESAFVFVISTNGSVLMGRRSMKSDHAGKWDFFGGQLKDGEDPKKGALREFLEETGIQPKTVGPHFVIKPKKKNRIIHVFCWFDVSEDSLKIKLSDEHSAFRWVPPSEKIGDSNNTKTAEIIMGTVIDATEYFKQTKTKFKADTVIEVDVNLVGFD